MVGDRIASRRDSVASCKDMSRQLAEVASSRHWLVGDMSRRRHFLNYAPFLAKLTGIERRSRCLSLVLFQGSDWSRCWA